ncbi:Na+/H+ antiporter [Emiliania huxleyi CCMP1516]|uniref:PTS EIIA type-2 domain-containing protein n=2 Tax=Emiliania huxleyi TaxID=2903 RepID=A0A0D3I4J4_EMIH1|nr:Na+/H+ antiporter [Emiliania huxleyi CCMP1516]EOD06179.1 Na+/H+ antiporter [Emiliania huxleyi CCMP1516]|eukprot:XP_005758608.1 Na+/H+ antiporter [Emiliania huxleyi CCMP1516]
MHKAAGPAPSKNHLFIELEELRAEAWTETGRWNHALEEDALPLSPGHDAADPTWSLPRLPTISVTAAASLQQALSPANIFLGLQADSLREIAEVMLQRLVEGGLLAAEQHAQVAEVLLSAKRLGRPVEGGEVGTPLRRIAGFEASDAEADELFHMLDPEKGEEAASLLLAHLDFISEPIVTFARLATPVDLGCEGQAPVRYLCLLLGPEAEAEASSRMAHAFGGILSDEYAVAALNRARSPQALLDALNAHLEGLSILPHVFGFSSAPRPTDFPGSTKSAGESTSVSESDDESVDEDEVLLAELEGRIRARKGMSPAIPPTAHRQMSRSVSREGEMDRSEAGDSPTPGRPTSSLGDRSGSQDGLTAATPRQRRRREEFQHRLDKLLQLSTEKLPVLPPPPGSALDAPADGKVVLDMASLRTVPARRRRLFISMEQAEAGVWRETDHWNWALAQEKATDGTWSRPHLPTISIASLMALYKGLGDHNVHLELPAVSLLEAVETVGHKLVQSGELPAAALPQVVAALSSRGAIGGGHAPDESALAPDANEEAALLLLAHVDFLEKPLMAFVRLQTCLLSFSKTPVRYLFFHLGPRDQAAASEKVGKALAVILLDEDFISASLTASSSRRFIRVLACQLDCMVVVPHRHFTADKGEMECGKDSGNERGGAREASVALEESTMRRAVKQLCRAEASAERKLEEGSGAVAAAARAQLDRLSQSRTGRASARRVSQLSHATEQHRRWLRRHLPLRQSASWCLHVVHILQRYSIPLLLGIVVALPWATFAPDSYEYWVGADAHRDHFMPFGKSADLFEHPVTLHFLVNDVFMCFFFGLAMKEVTESVLPGGSLNPPKKAMSSLVGTVGGVAGPIGVYLGLVALQWAAGSFEGYEMEPVDETSDDEHRRLLASAATNITLVPVTLSDLMYGWGVPTATDISIAWMVAMRVFPLRHPAIDYLLLLAVADDFIGLIIIALAYPDPLHPTQWSWATGLFGVFAVCLFLRVCMRKVACVQKWYVYVALGGVFSWIVLLNARLHPALALAFVVPFMPADGHHAALHAFEHAIKAPVDLGMFFFTLANAGIDLKGGVGGLTFSVLLALALGKVLGIAGFAYLAHRFGVARLPGSMRVTDLLMVGIIAAVGLTVALFISGEAFTDEALAGEAKMGSLLSICMGAVALALGQLPHYKNLAACPPPRKGLAFSDSSMEEYDEDDLINAVTSSLQRSMLHRKAFLAGDRYFADTRQQKLKSKIPELLPDITLEPVKEAGEAGEGAASGDHGKSDASSSTDELRL